MKITLLILFGLLINNTCISQSYLGLGVGILSTEINSDLDIKTESKYGAMGGIVGGYDFNMPFTLHGELLFVKKGTKLKLTEESSIDLNITYIQESLQLRFRLPSESQPHSAFIGFGGYLAQVASDKTSLNVDGIQNDIESDVNSNDYGLSASFGIKNDHFLFELKYLYSLDYEETFHSLGLFAGYIF